MSEEASHAAGGRLLAGPPFPGTVPDAAPGCSGKGKAQGLYEDARWVVAGAVGGPALTLDAWVGVF